MSHCAHQAATICIHRSISTENHAYSTMVTMIAPMQGFVILEEDNWANLKKEELHLIA